MGAQFKLFLLSFEKMVKPKKYLGQHFLEDSDVAIRIVNSLTFHTGYSQVLEIGPGTGVLTKHLSKLDMELSLIEIDSESVAYLKKRDYVSKDKIIEGDFLKIDPSYFQNGNWGIIGNFPYNISSQLFFRILEFKDSVMEVVCMLQKEVAERIASPPGNKKYGILSVFLQAYYSIEYLETVPPHVFRPPPKVDSGVVRLTRNNLRSLDCNERLFRRIVKQGFQNRRKTLRNALKPLNLGEIYNNNELMSCRAEQLSVQDFVSLTKLAEGNGATD